MEVYSWCTHCDTEVVDIIDVYSIVICKKCNLFMISYWSKKDLCDGKDFYYGSQLWKVLIALSVPLKMTPFFFRS